MDLPTPETPRFLSLTGYRGTGKTTVGKALARLIGYDFLDTDALVQEMAGQGIAAIFAAEGEPAFRDLETAVIESVVQRDQVIVALGGGAILREDNRQRLQHAGPIVWLTASPNTIRASPIGRCRDCNPTSRPHHTGGTGRNRARPS